MNITILCSDHSHPVVIYLKKWVDEMFAEGHYTNLLFNKDELEGGDVLFLVSCNQIITAIQREKFSKTLVLHASELPKDRGWSPYIWAVLEGNNEIVVSLLEAEDEVDTGPIWLQSKFYLDGTELLDEIYDKLFFTEMFLMKEAVNKFNQIVPKKQDSNFTNYRRKRTPVDSEIDPHKTIAEQFDLLRVVDFNRFPAYFYFRGKRYIINILKG